MRRTREDAERTRADILQAAGVVLKRRGYSSTRLEDVAQEAGVTRGAIYWHFRNKQDLYLNYLKEFKPGDNGAIKTIQEMDLPPLERLKKMIVAGLYDMRNNKESENIIHLGFLVIDLLRESGEVNGMINEKQAQMLGVVEPLIQEAIERGEVREDVDPAAAATILHYLFQGVWGAFLRDPDGFRPEEMTDAILSIFMHGITA